MDYKLAVPTGDVSSVLEPLGLASTVSLVASSASMACSTLYQEMSQPRNQAIETIKGLVDTIHDLRSTLQKIEHSLLAFPKDGSNIDEKASANSQPWMQNLVDTSNTASSILCRLHVDSVGYEATSVRPGSEETSRSPSRSRTRHHHHLRSRSRDRSRARRSSYDYDDVYSFDRERTRRRSRPEYDDRDEYIRLSRSRKPYSKQASGITMVQQTAELKSIAGYLEQLNKNIQSGPNLPALVQTTGNNVQQNLWSMMVERHKYLRERRDANKCDRALSTEAFQVWRIASRPSEPLNVLWCHGPLGCGKSFLVSHVVDSLQDSFEGNGEQQLVYFYFDSGHKQPVYACLHSILYQLMSGRTILPEVILQLWDGSNWRNGSTIQELIRAFSALIFDRRETFVILDGPDEIQPEFYDEMGRVIRRIKATGCKVFITTTTDKPIQPVDEPSWMASTSSVDLSAQREALPFYRLLSESPEIEVSSVPFDEGRILATSLSQLVQLLPRGLGKDTNPNLYAVLSGLVKEVIESAQGRRVKHVISAVYYARRPFALNELQCAMKFASQSAVDEDDETTRDEGDDLLAICGGILTQDTCSKNVVLAHKTVKDVLEQNPDSKAKNSLLSSESLLAKACLAYLLQAYIPLKLSTSLEDLRERLVQWPLLSYASSFWGEHLNNGRKSLETNEKGAVSYGEGLHLAKRLINDPIRLDALTEVVFYRRLGGRFATDLYPTGFSALHWIALFGLDELLDEYIAGVRQKDSWGRAPIHIAVIENRDATARKLLHADPVIHEDPDTVAGRSAIHYAAENGNLDVVKLLISLNASTMAIDKEGKTPLQVAASHGHADVVWHLIAFSNEGYDDTLVAALEAAAEGGEVELMQDLLRNGARPNTAVARTAVRAGLIEPLRLLLECGANIHDCSVLGAAVSGGNGMVVRLLLENGVSTNSSPEPDRTSPLHWAAKNGDVAVVNLLLRYGANINAKDQEGRTPLFFALENGHGVTASVLINRGAEMWTTNDSGRSPLLNAVSGQVEVVESLIKQGIRITSPPREVILSNHLSSGGESTSYSQEFDPEKVKQYMTETIEKSVQSIRPRSNTSTSRAAARFVSHHAHSHQTVLHIPQPPTSPRGGYSAIEDVRGLERRQDRTAINVTRSENYFTEVSRVVPSPRPHVSIDPLISPPFPYPVNTISHADVTQSYGFSPTNTIFDSDLYPRLDSHRLLLDEDRFGQTMPGQGEWFVVYGPNSNSNGDEDIMKSFDSLIGTLTLDPWSPKDTQETSFPSPSTAAYYSTTATVMSASEPVLVFTGGQERRCSLRNVKIHGIPASGISSALDNLRRSPAFPEHLQHLMRNSRPSAAHSAFMVADILCGFEAPNHAYHDMRWRETTAPMALGSENRLERTNSGVSLAALSSEEVDYSRPGTLSSRMRLKRGRPKRIQEREPDMEEGRLLIAIRYRKIKFQKIVRPSWSRVKRPPRATVGDYLTLAGIGMDDDEPSSNILSERATNFDVE